MQKITWSILIPLEEWRLLRRDLSKNGFSVPFTKGVAENRKTGYRVVSNYEHGKLTITVFHRYFNVTEDAVVSMLRKLFDQRIQEISGT